MTDEVNTLREGKAPGPDGIHLKFFNLLDDRSIKSFTDICNNIYNTGNIQNEWFFLEFIMLPKNRELKHPVTTEPSALRVTC